MMPRLLFGFLLFLAAPILQLWIFIGEWGAIALSLYCLMLFLFFKPDTFFHPLTIVFAYYFLWLVCPAFVDFYFQVQGIEYKLPWGRLWDWKALAGYTLFQVQMTMTILIMSIWLVTRDVNSKLITENLAILKIDLLRIKSNRFLSIAAFALMFYFIQNSGGIDAWLTDYSHTYLTGREGLGVINIAIICIVNLAVVLSGLKNFSKGGGLFGIIPSLPLILCGAYVGGLKSRFIILVVLFYLPYLLRISFNLRLTIMFLTLFVAAFYTLMNIRVSGFYSEAMIFVEYVPTYFNALPLHNLIVTSQPPDLFGTISQAFVKIGQALGLISQQAEYDISVMFTKQYFPDNWYNSRATQQWPLETDMYLNFYGVYGQFIPIALYGLYIGFLFRHTVKGENWVWLPVMAIETFRIISVMRGTYIPWIWPMLIVQYAVILFLASMYLPRRRATKHHGEFHCEVQRSVAIS